jgi:predicted O-methyltransferase YrrM
VRIQTRAVAGEVRWFVDPRDPLRRYNRQLARAFVTKRLHSVLEEGRLVPTEGHLLKTQARFIAHLMQRYSWITHVAEIGFNAGHSSYLFLSSRPDVKVLSFDLGDHEYIDTVKDLIDQQFPGRHELIKGDSRQTVPEYAAANPGVVFDLFYIDGGHDYDVAKADIVNGASLCGPRTIVLMDDLEPAHDWGAGPARAWQDAIADGTVEQTLLVEAGFPLTGIRLDDVDPTSLVWALGRYPSQDTTPHGAAEVRRS